MAVHREEGVSAGGQGGRRSMRRSMRSVSGTHISNSPHSLQYNCREDHRKDRGGAG